MSLFRLLPSIAFTLIIAFTSNSFAEEVNIYTGRKEALIKPILDQFTEQTGITVNLVTGKDDALITRLQNEGHNTPADILLTTDVGRLYRAQQADLFQSIDSKILAEAIPANYREPNGYWVGLSLRARPIFYNMSKINGDRLSSYEALATSSFKGNVCIRSSTNIYNQSLLASMIASNGEEAAEAWANGLVANLAKPPTGGDRDQIKAAAAGVCDVAVANTYYFGQMLSGTDEAQKEAAFAMGIFWPNQKDRGVHVNISGAGVIKSAKNKDNAVKLIEFLVSPEAQAWYAEANFEYPVREDVAPSTLLQSWGQFKADDINLSRLGELNEQAVKIMDRAGWK